MIHNKNTNYNTNYNGYSNNKYNGNQNGNMKNYKRDLYLLGVFARDRSELQDSPFQLYMIFPSTNS